ncbi:MAG: hypothetical protein ACJ8DJ_23290 [Gemmatimonadales bacterium]
MSAPAGSGGGGDDAKQPTTTVPAQVLVGAKDLRRFKRGSAERALLDYWSSLQFHAWPQAISFLDPRLRDLLGTERLSRALETGAGSFSATAPQIVSVHKRGRITTIQYRLRQGQGGDRLESSSWRREAGGWAMVFNSGLDPLLQSYVQTSIDGNTAGPPSKRAARAVAAVTGLQARFLASQKALLRQK